LVIILNNVSLVSYNLSIYFCISLYIFYLLNLVISGNENFIYKQINPIENILHCSIIQVFIWSFYFNNYNSGDK